MEYLPKTVKIKSLYTKGCDIHSLYLIRRTLEYWKDYPLNCYLASFMQEDLEGGLFNVERWGDNWKSTV